jgi:molybdopterin converting factor small subunit
VAERGVAERGVAERDVTGRTTDLTTEPTTGSRPAAPGTVTVRFFAGARQAAGVAEERLSVDEIPDLGALLDALAGRSDRLSRVLTACSFLVDGVSARDRATGLSAGGTVDVLPPFAGG